MKEIVAVVFAVTLLSGCASLVESLAGEGLIKDISTGGMTAKIVTPNANYCVIAHPVRGHNITFDAGHIIVVQQCSQPESLLNVATDGYFGSSSKTYLRTFYFDAEPERTYELTGGCLYLRDSLDTDEAETVACAPLMPGIQTMTGVYWTLPDTCLEEFALRKQRDPSVSRYTDPSSIVPFSQYWLDYCVDGPGGNARSPAAMVISGGTTPRQDTCWPSVQSGWLSTTRYVLLGLSAGPTRFDASCDEPLPNSGYRVRTASIDLDAKAGHIYKLSAENDACMGLLDITDEETLLACEPYHVISE